jgi:hypothetical protein
VVDDIDPITVSEVREFQRSWRPIEVDQIGRDRSEDLKAQVRGAFASYRGRSPTPEVRALIESDLNSLMHIYFAKQGDLRLVESKVRVQQGNVDLKVCLEEAYYTSDVYENLHPKIQSDLTLGLQGRERILRSSRGYRVSRRESFIEASDYRFTSPWMSKPSSLLEELNDLEKQSLDLATGQDLDNFATIYSMSRSPGETDEELRANIISQLSRE